MLGRYKIYRGKRPPDDPLPDGERQDTRKHTRHPLRPDPKSVLRYLSDPTPEQWQRFERDYQATLQQRFEQDRAAFDNLAEAARRGDVHIGCNCPTRNNPDVRHCHTWLALEFMTARYPQLDVRFPRRV